MIQNNFNYLNFNSIYNFKPFCDDSHKGTDFLPVRFSIEEPVKFVNLCGCKYTKTAPFCDGETCKKILSKDASEPLKLELENKTTENNDNKLK